MNPHALRLTQRLGFSYSSDCRGRHPFIPVWNAEIVNCPQLPTTLPTLDELIGVDGIDEHNVHERLLALTREAPANGHVFTLHAELEGMKLLPVFEKLLLGWQAQGYKLTTLRDLAASLDPYYLPRHEILWGGVPGRSGELLVQGAEFLSEMTA
jgi:undecaprenyl phosphate-alpha-L-ara4FN deformylase